MFSISRKLLILSCFLLTGFCFWKAGAGLIGGADTEILPSAQATVHPSFTRPQVVTTPIQEMRPGMRVVGRNPLRIQTEATIDPTPAGWRLVSVRMLKPDGTYFEAELLRPLSWISRHRAKPGAVIQLTMPELHVVGAAEVMSISACPPIDPGDGPVVLSTFKNTADNILNIYVEGEAEPIGVTAGHPIWSEDRQAFIHSDQLQPGERLRSALGKTVRITSIEIRAGPEAVYNLEVAGEHVYSVTDSGLLVHNTTACQKGLTPASFGLQTISEHDGLHKIYVETLQNFGKKGRNNAYTKYLSKLESGAKIKKKDLDKAWNYINGNFLERARKAGFSDLLPDGTQIHHWNYDKNLYYADLFNAEHLVPTPSRELHEAVHRATTSTSKIWEGPVSEIHKLPVQQSTRLPSSF